MFHNMDLGASVRAVDCGSECGSAPKECVCNNMQKRKCNFRLCSTKAILLHQVSTRKLIKLSNVLTEVVLRFDGDLHILAKFGDLARASEKRDDSGENLNPLFPVLTETRTILMTPGSVFMYG